MTRELPARPSLEHLKAQAKDLLEALRKGTAEGYERFRNGLPAAHGASDERLRELGLALHDAQSVIAREYGFQSWAELKLAVEEAAKSASAPTSGALSPEALKALMERVANTPPPEEVQRAMLVASSAPAPKLTLPGEYPLVALRNTVLPVGAIAPISIGRASSIAAVQTAQKSGSSLALFGQKSELDEAPAVADLHPIGCVASLHAAIPSPEGLTIVVRGERWVRLSAITDKQGQLRASVERFTVSEEVSPETAPLDAELRRRASELVRSLPDAAAMLAMIDRMSSLELADAVIANLKCSVAAKAEYAALPDVTRRMRYVIELVDAQ